MNEQMIVQFPLIALNFSKWILNSLWTGLCCSLRARVSHGEYVDTKRARWGYRAKEKDSFVFSFFSRFPSPLGFFLKPGSNSWRKAQCVISKGLKQARCFLRGAGSIYSSWLGEALWLGGCSGFGLLYRTRRNSTSLERVGFESPDTNVSLPCHQYHYPKLVFLDYEPV